MSTNERKIKLDEFKRPTNYEFLLRMNDLFNLSEIVRHIDGLDSKFTFHSQVKRLADMSANTHKKAQAEDVGELFNEVFYHIGVAIGKFPRDPHRKFKYFPMSEDERAEDPLAKYEAEKA